MTGKGKENIMVHDIYWYCCFTKQSTLILCPNSKKKKKKSIENGIFNISYININILPLISCKT